MGFSVDQTAQASPAQIGRLLWSYKQVWLGYRKAAKAGIEGVSTHTMRHTYSGSTQWESLLQLNRNL
jgi:integrase